jgi:hypothetical protein
MDDDDFFTSRPSDPLTLLTRQDLGPISQDELAERIVKGGFEFTRETGHVGDSP